MIINWLSSLLGIIIQFDTVVFFDLPHITRTNSSVFIIVVLKLRTVLNRSVKYNLGYLNHAFESYMARNVFNCWYCGNM